QAEALALQRVYPQPMPGAEVPRMRLLAFVAPGDLMANTPLEFLLEGSDVALDLLYVVPGRPLPSPLPEHDLAFVAVGESDENRPVLEELARLLPGWPRPVLNSPDRIVRLSREGTGTLLESAPGVVSAATCRLARATLEDIQQGVLPIERVLPAADFPVLVRPIGSHAGHGLAKLTDCAAIGAYLREHPEREFFLTRYIDYRSPDGLFRKARIAVIRGVPYACHLAISTHWMVHYLNAGMTESAEKRDEEARFMAGFTTGFARRHAQAIRAMSQQVGLEYFAVDCAETPNGRLLVFEVDVAMIVHAMDPPEMFPYKHHQMRKVFRAFRRMLYEAAGRFPG
ncbi:MAG TPA: hypothetical protein VEU07_10690, partial [Candidatus Acidoferrum sp.]|nr:hypothetical protein [Candidatus Acidoferrum sp.]